MKFSKIFILLLMSGATAYGQLRPPIIIGSGTGGSGSGTVTTIAGTNSTGLTWTITNPTTTPNLSIALTSAAVGLSNADNTSDATKNSATATLTNKTIAAGSNTITGLTNSNLSGSAGITNANLASGIDAAKITTGTLPTAQTAALTGAVTKPAGSSATTIAAQAVGVAEMTLGANKIAANNTGSTAAPTEINYNDPGWQTYNGTITWTAGLAPATPTNRYWWHRDGTDVSYYIVLSYGTSGTTITQVTLTLPPDMPAPDPAAGMNGATDITIRGLGAMSNVSTSVPTSAGTGVMNNSGLVTIAVGSGTYKYVLFQIKYKSL